MIEPAKKHGSPHILLVEDEPGIASTLIYALTTDGMGVTWKQSGQEAILAFRKTPADLIILDIGLPDANGLDICKKIRQESSVPILFLTARSDEVDRIVGLEIGGDDYVTKPFSPREVSARVRALLRRSNSMQKKEVRTEISSFGPFTIDRGRLIVVYFGSELRLPRYQFRIMDALLARPGAVMSRSELLDAVWDEPGERFDRAVDTQIKELRAALHAVKSGVDPIRTHRGSGYSLKDDW